MERLAGHEHDHAAPPAHTDEHDGDADVAVRPRAQLRRAGGQHIEAAPAGGSGFFAAINAGIPLPAQLRAAMETSFGHDFGDVRTHQDGHAEQMGALAYAQGNDLHFARGVYDPESARGRELIGHELAHVVQQAEGRVEATTQAKGVDVNADPSLEHEADRWGALAARGERVPRRGGTRGVSGGAIQRKVIQKIDGGVDGGTSLDGGAPSRAPTTHGDAGAAAGTADTPQTRAAAFRAAVATARWDDAVTAAARLDDAAFEREFRAVAHDRRAPLYGAALPTAQRARFQRVIVPLDLAAAYDGEVGAGAWSDAALHLNGFNDEDIARRVHALSDAAAAQMRAATQDWNHRVRRPLLVRLFEHAITAGDWHAALQHVTGFNEADLRAQLQTVTSATAFRGLLDEARRSYPAGHLTRRVLEEMEPAFAARPTAAGQPITAPGHSVTTPVPGGTAAVTTDTGNATDGTDQFAHSYTDNPGESQAPTTGWIQFIAIEFELFDAAGTSLGFHHVNNLPHPLASRHIDASDPAANQFHWTLDNLSSVAPFYESEQAAGAEGWAGTGPSPGGPDTGGNRAITPHSTTVYDRPASDPDVIRNIFVTQPNVQRVVERERFHDYLIRGAMPLYRDEVLVEFAWARDPANTYSEPPRTNRTTHQERVDALPNDQYRVMLATHPQWSFIRHQ